MAEKLNKDLAYKSAKPKEKAYSISDGGGLSLLIKSVTLYWGNSEIKPYLILQ